MWIIIAITVHIAQGDHENGANDPARDSVIGYLNEVTIAPITSTVREIPSEVRLDEGDGMRGECAANADHIQTAPKDRIGKLIAALSPDKLAELRNAIRFALDL